MYRNLFASLLSVVLLSACVKEQREACPCTLILEMGGVDSSRFRSLTVDICGRDDFFSRGEVTGFAQPYLVRIPKGMACVSVYYVENQGVSPFDQGALTVAAGEEFPCLWLHASLLDARAELRRDTVRLHKNWCRLDIKLISNARPVHYGVEIEGQVCGYMLCGVPEDGDFRVSLLPDAGGDCSLRIPRQKDASLALSITDGEGVLRRLAVGEYIVRSGYDWSVEDLEDLEVTIDFSLSRLSLKSKQWEHRYIYEIEI